MFWTAHKIRKCLVFFFPFVLGRSMTEVQEKCSGVGLLQPYQGLQAWVSPAGFSVPWRSYEA